jgi:hypothetical protein
MTDISPAIEEQIIRVLEAFTRAADRVDQRTLAQAAEPGRAADYARRHPAATITDIMAATGCSRTTARQARRALPSQGGSMSPDWRAA